VHKALAVFLLIAIAVGPSVGASAAPLAAAPAEVHIVGGAPNPQQLTINDGDTVTFVNDDDVPHSIWAAGQQRGRTIQPHTRSDTFGPFQTAGQGGRSEYTVDQNGAPGSIVISGAPAPTTAPTTTTTTTAPTTTTTTTVPTTTTTATTTSTTTTTTKPTTTSTAPTTSSSSGAPAGDTSNDDTPARTWLGWAGLVVALVGIGNVIRVLARPKQHLRPMPVPPPVPVEPPEPEEATDSDEPSDVDEPPDQA